MAVLGRRHWYRYDSDDGKSYKIKMLDYLAKAVNLALDDTLPELPRRYQPRYVWVQEVDPHSTPGSPIRKKLILNKEILPEFKQNSVLEVAGIKMKVKSYIGESRAGGGRNDKQVSQVRVQFLNESPPFL
jgi:hypothetical protein